jgi:hypothetical protein
VDPNILLQLECGLKLPIDLDDFIRCLLISRLLLQSCGVRIQEGIFVLSETCATLAGNQREAHQNICSGKLLSAQILAVDWRSLELVLEEGKVSSEVWCQEAAIDLASYAVGNRTNEKGNGAAPNV